MSDTRAFVPQWPDRIAVIGGGRWARVLTGVLCGLVPPSVRLSVHSPRNAGGMEAWASAVGAAERVHVSADWPQLSARESSAVIVANAARDHEQAVERSVGAGAPVLVEKPIAMTAAAAQRIVNLAQAAGVRFAAAHIFLFARYVDRFRTMVGEAGPVRHVRVQWADPPHEWRYGERKSYDPSLPIFADCLPHVLSVISPLAPSSSSGCRKLTVLRGGARIELQLALGDVLCDVELARNSDRRHRCIEVTAGDGTVTLDFSHEPGTISRGSTTIAGDPEWSTGERPAARMLSAFLRWAAGGACDERLDPAAAVRACHVIDEISREYRASIKSWLGDRLVDAHVVDDDLKYAFTELLHSDSLMKPT